jgi:predicted outer membrane repeat protein
MTREPARKLSLLCAALSFCFATLEAQVIYVNQLAVGANNGSSWANAFTNLSNALSTATGGSEVWVAQGVYKPSIQIDINAGGGSDLREVSFQIPGGVAVYGGFNGTELSRDDRNAVLNLTILSGDIDNNDVNADANQIAETTADLVGNNAYHVIYTENASATTRLDGFTITAGKADWPIGTTDPNRNGGGWFNRITGTATSSPVLAQNVFRGNYALGDGGGFYTTQGIAGASASPQVLSCVFRNNQSGTNAGAMFLGSFQLGTYAAQISQCQFLDNQALRRGGAIYLIGDASVFDQCSFTGNAVTVISEMGLTMPGSGGAVTMTQSDAHFNACMFIQNSATGNPTGAFEGGGGGAVYMSSNEPQSTSLGVSQPMFTRCGFYNNIATGNTAAWGGAAVHLSDGGKLQVQYINCVFSGNQAQNNGGAVASFARVLGVADGYTPELKPSFTNCTFTQNTAGTTGGAIFHDGFVYDGTEVLVAGLENSVLWGNAATGSGPEIAQSGNHFVAHSLIAGSGGSGPGWLASLGTDGGNNIATNPLFANAAQPFGGDGLPGTLDDGLALSAGSPAINEGNSAAAGLIGVTVDFRLSPRVSGGVVDMGAYEYQGIVVPDFPLKYLLYDWRPFRPNPCLFCPWAFRFADRILQEFVWDGPAVLEDNGKEAVISGNIVNLRNKEWTFRVRIKLENRQDWSGWSRQGRTWFAISPEAILTARNSYKKWTYWEISSESVLEGTGKLTGIVKLSVPSDLRTGFQLGNGANAWDKDLGMGGIFRFRGEVAYNGKVYTLNSLGSMNVDLVSCASDCPRIPETDPVIVDNSDASPNAAVQVFPNPFTDQLTISLGAQASGVYQIRLYNNTGQLKVQASLSASSGHLVLRTGKLEKGLYLVQITDGNGAQRQVRVYAQ